RLRASGERAFAQLKSWRLLRRARCSTRRIGTIVQAVHTLLTCSYSG
ncbi:IS5/IS1182 family transposase, partial [Streptomyces sp. CSDS2]|nr:IS5/IS1182 family transposase [Streptomyces sp. CSDS2]